jgi:hypothetical protein
MTIRPACSIAVGALLLAWQGRNVSPPPPGVRHALYERLKRDVLGHPWSLEFDSTTVFIRSDSSRVVAGLRYYWATYAPPGTADMLWEARAAAVDSSVRTIDGPGDWIALVGTRNWRPQSQPEAISACAELIAHASSFSRAYPHSLAYVGPQSLKAISGYERRLLRKVPLQPPQADLESGGQWVVLLWAIEPERSTRYECRPAAPNGGLAALDSVMVGRIVIGP